MTDTMEIIDAKIKELSEKKKKRAKNWKRPSHSNIGTSAERSY